MIINTNTNPQREIYYLGALVLEILNEKPIVELFDLYENLNSKEEINMHLFIFVLDWLFILNTIKHDNGKIQLCL